MCPAAAAAAAAAAASAVFAAALAFIAAQVCASAPCLGLASMYCEQGFCVCCVVCHRPIV
jgi:hypothetical protein